ncbi:TniB family NTP-binding protein [Streptomyces inhibens]|uniref:TniB family NTP-binding protein n=1 Tax=Streptomyces inhibens TaxID=2293571 RepID=UPI00402AA3EB
MWSALVAVAGYVPVPLTRNDYLELLPVRWQAITASGIRIHHRTYDHDLLAPTAASPPPHRTRREMGDPLQPPRPADNPAQQGAEGEDDSIDDLDDLPDDENTVAATGFGSTTHTRKPTSGEHPTPHDAEPEQRTSRRGRQRCGRAVLAPDHLAGLAALRHNRPRHPAPTDDPPRSLEERLAYHSAFVTIRTPAISTLATQVRALMVLGRHQQATARFFLIVTGPAAAGKTTALLRVGRACHLAHTRKTPAPPGSAHAAVPVAYVLVPPGATAKTLITEFARYLGIPTTTRMTQTQITDAVCHTYTQVGVQLVLIDEIHRLNPRTTTGAQTADLLKDLTERLPSTFVYAGINVTDTPLFTGTRGAQLAGRATLITCGPLPARHGQTRPFTDVITDIENASTSSSTNRRPPPARPYLHRRTAGRIGSLTKTHPPSRHHRHLRRHRTHHQTIPRRGTARPPRRNPAPPRTRGS